jgi:hypothetical protein
MEISRPVLCWLIASSALLLNACQEGSQSPPARPESPVEEHGPQQETLGPVDLVYVCGNKFLVTNATAGAVQVEYRVMGTDETGKLTLEDGSEDHTGYSETELQTKAAGPVELYRDGDRVARRLNERSPCGPAPFSGAIAGATEAESGSWTAPFPWTGVATHLNLLSTGKVLSFGELVAPQVWDPETGSFTSVPSPVLLFCSGHSFLADGRLLVSGGHLGTNRGFPDISLFSPATESWSRSTPMTRGRWYPTATTLGSGDVVMLAGRDQAAVPVLEPEVWSGGAVRKLTTAALELAYYPRAFLAPNGKVYVAGENGLTRYLDPTGTGSWTTGPTRRYGKRDYGAAVMYDVGKILYVGGGRTTNTAEIIDLNSMIPKWEWTGSMASPRRHLNATVLPTGDVLVTGGTSGTDFNDLTQPTRAAELWSPTTGIWTILASSTVIRGYHSSSILLPDGRVLHAGSGDKQGAPDQLNAELFSPPYLFNGPRPTITGAPTAIAYGDQFTITTPDAEEIAKASLIRLGSATHAFDMNQRFQWLSFAREAGALTVSAPTIPNRAPPGHYMLFILNGNGVPSMAKIVKLGSEGDPPPPPPPTPIGTTTTITGDGPDPSDPGVAITVSFSVSASSGTPTGPVQVTDQSGGACNGNAPSGSCSYTPVGTGSRNITATYQASSGFSTSSDTEEHTVTAPPPPPSSVTLSVTGRTDATKQYMTLAWSTAAGTTMDVYRNGAFLRNVPNTGSHTDSRTFVGAATYEYKVCGAGTSACSNLRTVWFSARTPLPIPLDLTAWNDATRRYLSLRWTGASGSTVDIYRNGSFLKNTGNTGSFSNTFTYIGPGTYRYQVCQTATTTCSGVATLKFGG